MGKPINILSGPGALAYIGEGGRLLVTRERIGDAIELLVALLDIADRTPDEEEPGLEDSFTTHPENGPGCEVADAGGPGWIERNNQTRRPYGSSDPSTIGAHEDAEDDDPAEDSEPLEHNGDEQDGNPAEDEFMYHGGSGAGCPVGDPGGCEHDGREQEAGI